ncbi:hemolysin family protein [Myroides ceti]|uniref:Hemolysin family protein n=1 Tax=Paenimyroides ceti TaxID=395087 RepID=A0ABT8CQ85_9FLAO|nr:hemolysin family protein [Paenimyroides ceti]MDN3705921.1 hemolysin family protein [Paenimyroides ceti]
MEIVVILFLILLNGVFSMSEMALVSLRKNRLEIAAKKGSSRAKTALELANEPNNFLSTVQIGITLIGILTGIYSGDKVTSDVQLLLEQIEVLRPYASSLSVGIVVVILTFLTLIMGELLPKRLGLNHPEAIAKIVAMPMKIISKIASPFVWLLTTSTDLLMKIFNIKPTADGKVTEEEIRSIIKESTMVGEVQEIEQDIVERVFNVGDRKVNSLMTHRKSVVYLDCKEDLQTLKTKVIDELHSFYPICENSLDEVIGVVSLKNLFLLFEKENFDLKDAMTEPTFLIEHTSAYKALELFKSTKNHYALVTDEYGVVQGVITLNDILEALVGDASEFYEEEFKLEEVGEGKWVVDGFYPLHDLLAYFELDDLMPDYDVTTVSGLVMKELSYIPKTGEKLIWNKMELEVLASSGVKIDKIGISLLKE